MIDSALNLCNLVYLMVHQLSLNYDRCKFYKILMDFDKLSNDI
jgi:hypothetical protein